MIGLAGAFISIINLLIRAALLEARLSAGISLNTFLTPYHRTTGRIIQPLHRFSRSVKKVKTNFLKKIIALTKGMKRRLEKPSAVVIYIIKPSCCEIHPTPPSSNLPLPPLPPLPTTASIQHRSFFRNYPIYSSLKK